jgi:hypothetical protein
MNGKANEGGRAGLPAAPIAAQAGVRVEGIEKTPIPQALGEASPPHLTLSYPLPSLRERRGNAIVSWVGLRLAGW